MPQSAEVTTWSAPHCNSNRFQLLLVIQYHAVALLINGPVTTNCLKQWQSGVNTPDQLPPLLEAVGSTLVHDFGAASEMLKLISHLINFSPEFLVSNAAWWICNFNGKIWLT
jgi:hypothetical protein